MSATEDTKTKSISQDTSAQGATLQPVAENNQSSSPGKDGASTAVKTENSNNEGSKGASANAQPLAPPPKPSQQSSDSADYFSGSHGQGNNSHFSLEPNPFEQSFGNPSSGETPGKFGGLPSVASLTSPQPLGPGGTPNWQNSLRSGPLSPALLPGPSNSNSGYFDENLRNSFPTPNESSLRTGLTPGGGGSMFPAPSPGSSGFFNLQQGGGATPGTLDFQRTAMNARARQESQPKQNGATNTQPVQQEFQAAQGQSQQQQPQQQTQNQAQSQASTETMGGNAAEGDAVNSLFMLAQNGNRNANQFAQQQQQQQQQVNTNVAQMQPQNTSPATQQTPRQNNVEYENNEGSETKPARGRGKKGGAASKGSANGKRKSDGPQSGRKRSKASNNTAEELEDQDLEDDFDESQMDQDIGSGGKKVSEEEKRKNFLERNRIAALKCRQRKKQWLANLQTKVEFFTSENDALNTQNAQLREEVMNLKSLLVAHKDCPVSHSQGLGGQNMMNVMGGDLDQQGFNSMPMQNAPMIGVQQGGQGMQRS